MERQAWVRWSGQYEFHRLAEKAPSIATDHYGLYMILETLTTRRALELIYLGIVWSDRRDLYTRINEHRKDWLHKVAKNQIFVKFGVPEAYVNIDRQLVEDIESTLVFGAQPRENTAKKSGYTYYDELIVKNINHEDFLKPSYKTETQRVRGA